MKRIVTTPVRLYSESRSVFRTSTGLARSTYWLSGALAVVAAAAAAATFFIPGVLRGPAVMNGSARGTALVILVVAVPALLLSMRSAVAGSVRALIVWLGAIAYIAYQAVLFTFETPFNQLFLLYLAMFSLSFWSVFTILRQLDLESLRARFSPKLPVRGLATYALIIVVLNALAWLRNVIPGVLNSTPPSWLDGTGTSTNAIYVQDLAFWLPLMAVAAIWLWRRKAWGYLLVGSILTMWVIESLSVAVDQWMGSAADSTSTVASATMTPVFGVLALVGLIPLYFYFHHLSDID
jgi:hypothetical protein